LPDIENYNKYCELYKRGIKEIKDLLESNE